jgi:hypothetical protein
LKSFFQVDWVLGNTLFSNRKYYLYLSFFVFAPPKAWRVGAQGLRALTNWGLAKAAE